jgi:thiol-disulfide isomerase/thioredoxin
MELVRCLVYCLLLLHFDTSPIAEEFRMPLTLSNLLRYLRLRGVAGDPANVQQFTSSSDVQHLVDSTHTPVFVKFFEPWCAHCHKMKRGFEAGATFFKGRVHFLEVQCSTSESSKAFCTEHGVERFPSLKLFTGEAVVPFTGSRAVAAYELFFHENKEAFPDSPLGVVPAFNVDQLQLTESEAALIGHGYPIQEQDVAVPDTSLPIITDEINAARKAVARDDAEEAMAAASVDAAGGVSRPTATPKATAAPAAPAAAAAADTTNELMAALLAEMRGMRGDLSKLNGRVGDLESKPQ